MSRIWYISLAISVVGAVSVVRAVAAPVGWGAPHALAADSDVNTNGTLVAAVTGAASATIVNSVTFSSFAGNWTYSITNAGGNVVLANQAQAGYPNFIFNNATTFTSGSAPFASLSAAYRTLLAGADFSGYNGTSTGGTDTWNLTFSGLAAGTQYELQLWVNDPRTTGATRNETVDDGCGNSVLLRYNNQGAAGGVGTYVSGVFTADTTGKQTINLKGNSSTQLNACQLRTSVGPAQIWADAQDQSVLLYHPAVFSVTARGQGPFRYRWYRGGASLPNATNRIYALANAQMTDSGAQFACVVSNYYNSVGTVVTSRWAVLTVTNSVANLNPAGTHQTIEGFGGALAFYQNWLTAHPYKQEIYTNIFTGLNLSMLRLGNWFRYQGTVNFDPNATDIVSNANRIFGYSVPIEMSSWSPPASLKSNGTVGNCGTLATNSGGFVYRDFANYWYDSLLWYKTNGVVPTWVSIQNEPDFAAGYDSCVFHPTEDTVNGTNYASYAKALDATYQRLTNLPSPPKLLGPEVVGIGYNDVQNYATTMNSNSFYGVAHHLYHGGSDSAPNTYIPAMQGVTSVFPGKPKFMTEYGVADMIDGAWLIHNALTVEEVSGYNFWSLVWPAGYGLGLVEQEYPWNQSYWTNAPPGTPTQSHGYWLQPCYFAMKHYSYFIRPGYKRIDASGTDSDVLISAYISPASNRLVTVFINAGTNASLMSLNFGVFTVAASSVYQSVTNNAATNQFANLGPLTTNQQVLLPAASITTVVADAPVVVSGSFALKAADALGSSSFNAAGNWTNVATGAAATSAPTNTYAYLTGPFALRTPATAGNYTFGGASLTISSGGGLNIKGGGGNTITINNLTNGGTINNAINPSQIAVIAGNMVVVGGTLNVSGNPGGGDNRAITSAMTMSGTGALTNTGTGYVVYTANNSAFTGPVVVNGATALRLSSLANLGGAPASFNPAQLLLDNGIFQPTASFALTNANSGVTLGAGGGTFLVSPGLSLTVANPIAGSGNLTNSGGGTLVLACTNTFSGNTLIGAAGSLLKLTGGGSIAGSRNLVISGGTPASGIDVSTRNDGTLTLASGQTLRCDTGGYFNGNLIAGSGATVWPGGNNLIQTMVVSNILTFQPGSTNALDFNRNPVTNDFISVGGTLTFGGTLQLVNNGAVLVAGDSFKLFTAAGYTGAFAAISPASPGAGLTWDTSLLAVAGIISVKAPPVISSLFPQNPVIECSSNASFTVAATGSAPLSYQWSVNGSPVLGATSTTFMTNNLPGEGSVYTVSVAVTNAVGTASSNTLVTVQDTLAPVITQCVPAQTLTANSNCQAVLPDLRSLLVASDACSGALNLAQVPAPGTLLSVGATNVSFRVDDGNGNTNTCVAVLTVLPVVATNPTNLTLTVVNGALELSWPADHTGWRLQAQTNDLTTGVGTNWFIVPDSSTTNRLGIPLDVGSGSLFYRLVYP